MIQLKEKLSLDQQAIILAHFGFAVEASGAIYDDGGDEFYGFNANDKWDLTNLDGILDYAKHQGFQNGVWDTQRKIKQAIGL